MLFVLLLLGLQGSALLPGSEAWICGRLSECECRRDLWIICKDVKASPNFKPGLRRYRSLLMTVTDGNDFDISTLDLTHGYRETILSITNLDQQFCHEVVTRYPWIRCIMQQPTTGCPSTSDTSEPTMTTEQISQTPDQEIYSLNLEARVTFGLEKVTIGNEANKRSIIDVLKPWLKSPALFWSCVTLGAVITSMIMVITITLVKKRRSNRSLGVICLDALCKLCLCPCKCLDKLRSRERPYYGIEMPTQSIPIHDSSESVELYNASKRDACK